MQTIKIKFNYYKLSTFFKFSESVLIHHLISFIYNLNYF